MADRPKLVPLDPADEMQASIDAMKREMPKFLEHAALTAQFKRAYYEALVKEGFNEAQALELCKAPAAMV